MTFLDEFFRSDSIHQTVWNFALALLVRMATDRELDTIPNVALAAALLKTHKNTRESLTIDKIQSAKSIFLRFAEVPDEVIVTNHIINEEFEDNPLSSDSNAVNVFFSELGIGTTNPTSVESVRQTMSNTADELSIFVGTVNENRVVFAFFRDLSERWSHLSKATRKVPCVLPSPASADEVLSKTSIFFQEWKNLAIDKGDGTPLFGSKCHQRKISVVFDTICYWTQSLLKNLLKPSWDLQLVEKCMFKKFKRKISSKSCWKSNLT